MHNIFDTNITTTTQLVFVASQLTLIDKIASIVNTQNGYFRVNHQKYLISWCVEVFKILMRSIFVYQNASDEKFTSKLIFKQSTNLSMGIL